MKDITELNNLSGVTVPLTLQESINNGAQMFARTDAEILDDIQAFNTDQQIWGSSSHTELFDWVLQVRLIRFFSIPPSFVNDRHFSGLLN